MGKGLYRWLKKLHLQDTFNWTARVPCGDRRLAVPIRGRLGGEILNELAGRSWKRDFFQRLLPATATLPLVDVGANLGQTLVQRLAAGPLTAPYLAFEPNPVCAGYLARLLAANRLEAVDLFPAALSSAEECRLLELTSDDDASASMVPNLRAGRTIRLRRRIACFSLDRLWQERTVPLAPGFLLKIDVEGAESAVLAGARKVLTELRPIVQCEVLWAHSAESLPLMAESNARLQQLLREAGYQVFRLQLDPGQTALQGLEPFDRFPSGVFSRSGNSHQCDYVFLPAERVAELAAVLSG